MTVSITLANGSVQVVSNVTDCKNDPVAKTLTLVVDLTNVTLVENQ